MRRRRLPGVLTASVFCLVVAAPGVAAATGVGDAPAQRAADGSIEARKLGGSGFGYWRPETNRFYMDLNGNGRWDRPAGGDSVTGRFGRPGDSPIVGDWNGDGVDQVGVWRPSSNKFLIDHNGNGAWDGVPGGDAVLGRFGSAGGTPIVGDWDGDGIDEIGLYRPDQHRFYLDLNGNGTWDGAAGGDEVSGRFGMTGDTPIVGDWNGDGADQVGYWRSATRRFYLDLNGNCAWDGAAGGDEVSGRFGRIGDAPIVGDWNGDGIDEIAVWRPGSRRFLVDFNGNGTWDGFAGGDGATGRFGRGTDTPIVGAWQPPTTP